MLSTGVGLWQFGSTGSVSDAADGGYSAEATALFARMTTQPSAAEKAAYNACIVALKDAGIWAKGDVLQVYAVHDSQAATLNWLSTSYTATLVNAPSWTAYRGYTTNGTNNYVVTGLDPSAAPQSTLNSMSMALWVNKARARPIIWNTVSPAQSLLYASGDTSLFCSLNVVNSGADTLTVFENIHMLAVSRTGAAASKGYSETNTSATFTRASTAISAATIRLGARNNGGAADSYNVAEYGAFWHGSSLSDGEVTSLRSALNTLMYALGNYKYGVACWGDSRTLGSTQTPFPTTVRTAADNRRVAYNGGVSGETSTQIKTRMLADTTYQQYVQVIWAGYNNHNDVATVEADIAAMVAEATTNNGGRYLVLTIPASRHSSFYPGTGSGDNIAAINAWIMSTYGSKAVDVATTVYAGDPNDVIALAYVIDPVTDYNHLNTAGLTLVATDVEAACVANGW